MLGLRSLIRSVINSGPNVIHQQTRNTFILKRKTPLPLHKKGGRPGKMRGRHFVYDLVEDTNVIKKPDIKVILSQFIDGVGNEGDILTLRPNQAYRDYLIPGLAVYASPKNLEKYKANENKPKAEDSFSSPYVHRTIGCLTRLVLQITMNKMEPWILEPWHISASFRKSGFIVPEQAIEMPPVQIKGPDLSLQDKEFYVTVIVCKRRNATPCHNHVKCILYKNNICTKDMMYGQQNEHVATSMFMQQYGKTVRPSGLFIDEEFGFLAASPDGIIEAENTIVEIKCFPSLERKSQNIREASENRNFPIHLENDVLVMNKKHNYYYQINKSEKVNVRCRIHHWATGVDRLPWEEFHWKKPKEPLIPEQASDLEKMTLPQ